MFPWEGLLQKKRADEKGKEGGADDRIFKQGGGGGEGGQSIRLILFIILLLGRGREPRNAGKGVKRGERSEVVRRIQAEIRPGLPCEKKPFDRGGRRRAQLSGRKGKAVSSSAFFIYLPFFLGSKEIPSFIRKKN